MARLPAGIARPGDANVPSPRPCEGGLDCGDLINSKQPDAGGALDRFDLRHINGVSNAMNFFAGVPGKITKS